MPEHTAISNLTIISVIGDVLKNIIFVTKTWKVPQEFAYPRQVHCHTSHNDDPDAQQRYFCCPPAKYLLANRGILKHNESAECDQCERQMIDKSDRPPHLHGSDTHDVAERPALEDVVCGVGGDGDQAEEKVAEGLGRNSIHLISIILKIITNLLCQKSYKNKREILSTTGRTK